MTTMAPRTRLVYGEDITPGMWIEYDRPVPPQDRVYASIFVPRREKGYVLVHEVRKYGSIVSVIVIDEEGEQQPLGLPEYGLTRVLVQNPLPDDLSVAHFEEQHDG